MLPEQKAVKFQWNHLVWLIRVKSHMLVWDGSQFGFDWVILGVCPIYLCDPASYHSSDWKSAKKSIHAFILQSVFLKSLLGKSHSRICCMQATSMLRQYVMIWTQETVFCLVLGCKYYVRVYQSFLLWCLDPPNQGSLSVEDDQGRKLVL